MKKKPRPKPRPKPYLFALALTALLCAAPACVSTEAERERTRQSIRDTADAIHQVTHGTPVDPLVSLAENLGLIAVGIFGGAGATHVAHKRAAKAKSA